MPTLTYDFEGDTIGQPASGWAELWKDNASGSALVVSGQRLHADAFGVTDKIIVGNTDVSGLSDVIVSGVADRKRTEAFAFVYLRYDGSDIGSENGYVFQWGNGDWYLVEYTNGSTTILDTDTYTPSINDDWNFKVECTGNTIRAKLYQGAEPGTWLTAQTDTTHSSGDVALADYAGSQGVYFDDISIESDEFAIDVEVTQDPVGALSVAGLDPSVSSQNHIVQSSPGTLTLPKGVTHTVKLSVSIEAGFGTLEVAGLDPEVGFPTNVDSTGTLEVAGFNPTVSATASAIHLFFKFKDAASHVWTKEIGSRPTITTTSSSVISSSFDEHIFMDATAGDRTVSMVTASGRSGFEYSISKTDSSANTVTVDPSGAETINGDSDFILYFQDETVTIVSDGSNWRVI